jgi:hypothetical protein
MIQEKVDSKNFDKSFGKYLEGIESDKIVKGRFDIEPVEIEVKLNFIVRLILAFKPIASFTYKILYWEEDDLLKRLIETGEYQDYSVAAPYKNGELPGIIFVDGETFDESFFKLLLTNHFNYELAKEPSLNLRVQICINYETGIVLLDVYDDRGFDIYYIVAH